MADPPSTAAASSSSAVPESSSPVDSVAAPSYTVAAVAAAAHQPPAPRQFLSSPQRPPPPPPPPPPNPIISGRPIIAKPLASPSHQSLLYATTTAHHPHPHLGFAPRSTVAGAVHRPPDHAAVSVTPGYIRASAGLAAVMTFANAQGRPFVYAGDRPVPVHHIRVPQAPPATQQQQQHAPPSHPTFLVPRPASTLTGPSVPGTSAGVGPPKIVPITALPKVNAFPPAVPATELKSIKDRERSRDDDVVVINDRKVRILDGGSYSLYSLCRSWVWNDMPRETQPNFGDGQRLLPKPLPMSVVESQVLNDGESDDRSHNMVNEKPEGSIEELSTRDLLEEHIKHAKVVRARLKKERLLRIERYKQRLALLLPPPSELGRDAAT